MTRKHKQASVLAALAILAIAAAALAPTAAAGSIHNESIDIDDNVTAVEADLSWSGDATVEVAVEDGDAIDDNVSVSGVSGDSQTVTLSNATTGPRLLNVTSTDEANVSVETTRITAENTFTDADPANETYEVAVWFESVDNASATLDVVQDGLIHYDDTVEYVADDWDADEAVLNRYVDDSDGFEAGDLTAKIALEPAGAYNGLNVSVSDSSGGAWLPDDSDSALIVLLALALIVGVVLIGGDD